MFKNISKYDDRDPSESNNIDYVNWLVLQLLSEYNRRDPGLRTSHKQLHLLHLYDFRLVFKANFPYSHTSQDNADRQIRLRAAAIALPLPYLTLALRSDQRYVDAHFNRGKALQLRGDFRGAIRDFSTAIEIQPALGGAYDLISH